MAIMVYQNGAFQDVAENENLIEIDISAAVANYWEGGTAYPAARCFRRGNSFIIAIDAKSKIDIPIGDIVVSDTLPLPEIAIVRGFFQAWNARFGHVNIRNGKIELTHYAYEGKISKGTYIAASIFGFFV